MTVIKKAGLTPAVDDFPLNHSRVGHSRNWQTGGTITTSGTATGYFEEAPDNSLTYEKWKPDSPVGSWEHAFAGIPEIDYCGIAGHTLGSDQSALTVQSRGDKRTNLITTSENYIDWSASTTCLMIPNSRPTATGLMTMTTALNFNLAAGGFDNVAAVAAATINDYAVFSLEVAEATGVNAETNIIIFRLEGTNFGGAGATNSTYQFRFSDESITYISGEAAAAVGVEKLSDTNYRIFLAVAADTTTVVRVYSYWGSAPADRSAVCFGNMQVEDNSAPEPTSYIPSLPEFTSRASSGTYYDKDGVIQLAPADTARYNYGYSDGAWRPAGLLLEQSKTNLLTQSEDFQAAPWVATGATLTPNASTAPDGAKTATLLQPVVTNADSLASVSAAITYSTNTATVYSFYVKYHKTQWVLLRVNGYSAGNTELRAYFDIKNGLVGGLGDDELTAHIEDVGNGFYRISVIFRSDSVDNAVDCQLYITKADGTADVFADENQGVYIWGAQLEQFGKARTSYIATSGSTQTRSADVLTSGVTESDWHDVAPSFIPPDDSPIMVLTDPITVDSMRVSVRGNIAPELSVVKFGKALQLPRPFYGGHMPIDFAREIVYKNNKGTTGEFLGRSKKSVSLKAAYSITNVPYEWLTENWRDWQLAMEDDPVFWAWRPDNYPFVGYVETVGMATPEAQGLRDWYTINIEGMGLGYE